MSYCIFDFSLLGYTLSARLAINQLINSMISSIDLQYSYLEKLLAEGKWQEADQATAQLMLQIDNKEAVGWLDPKSIKNFPCAELCTIDRLWMQYSNGRFGFSVQSNILSECGQQYQQYNYQSLCKLGDRLGWRKGWWDREWKDPNQLIFDLKAPKGHLPLVWFWWYVVGDLRVWNISLQLICRRRNCIC